MDDDPFEEIVPRLADGAAALLGRAPSGTPDDFRMVYHLGQGYAIPNPEDTPYIQELARMEGILLDPVYTGKAWSGTCAFWKPAAFPVRRIFCSSTLAARQRSLPWT
ncbi:MAG: hypothetical protein V8R75_05375 [Oscillospiraceae bacterium]